MAYNRITPFPEAPPWLAPAFIATMSAAPNAAPTGFPKTALPKGRQAYYCGDCGRRTIPDAAYQRPSAADKERALAMYQEGSSLSAIARIFGVSVQAVSQWVKKEARRPAPDAPAG